MDDMEEFNAAGDIGYSAIAEPHETTGYYFIKIVLTDDTSDEEE